MAQLCIATAQFPVSAEVKRNEQAMARLMQQSHEAGADVVHFSEACLGGYAGAEIKTWDRYNWRLLHEAQGRIHALAASLELTVIYGTNHRHSETDIRNRLNVVSAAGTLLTHYDKRFCTSGDLNFYTSGQEFATFDLKGFRCGLLICYDIRFPELYRAYKQQGVQVIFQSFHNAHAQAANIHTTIMRPTLQARAATNYFYISANNASNHYQSWPSVFVLPDGRIAKTCRQHRRDIIVNTISSTDEYYDASAPYRDRAMAGILHSENDAIA